MEIIKNKREFSLTKELKIFLYGKAFSGKTSFAATFPKPLLISTDGNYKHLDIDVVMIRDVMERKTDSGVVVKESGWLNFKKLIDAIEGDTSNTYETVIIDLTKDIYDLCRTYVLKSQGAVHESDIKQQGKIWALLSTEFLPVLRKIKFLNKNVIFIAHEKTDEEGYVYPALIQSLTLTIQSYVDMNARLYIKSVIGQPDGQRVLAMKPSSAQEGGNRLANLKEIVNPTYNAIIEELKQVLEKERQGK